MPMTPDIAVAFFAIIKLGAIVLPLFSGLWRRRHRRAPRRCRRSRAHHRRRHAAERPHHSHQAGRRRSGCTSAVDQTCHGGTACRRGCAHAARPGFVVGRDRSSASPPNSPLHARPPTKRSCSSTRRAPPASPKVRCTRIAVFRSRLRRTCSMASTCVPATRCSGSRISDG